MPVKASLCRRPRSNRANLLHLRDEVTEEVLDAVTERRRRARAAGAGAAHMQEHDAVSIALEGDIAAVLGDRWAHPRLEQLLDRVDGVSVFRREELVLGPFLCCLSPRGNGIARLIVFHNGAEDRRLQMLPLAVALGHADEI